MDVIYETDRLLARRWTMDDLESAFAIYRDPEVTTYIGGPVPDIETQRERMTLSMERTRIWSERGLGGWALVRKEDGAVVGTSMLKPIPFSAHLDPKPEGEDIEVGWHLGRTFWGHGYAFEGAQGALDHGFHILRLPRIIAVVNPLNERSLSVARRLAMEEEPITDRYYDQTLCLFSLDAEQYRLTQS